MQKYDTVIIGGGAAGIFAAIAAIDNGKHIAIVDMGKNPLRKVAVSGGGRCNFTNTAANRDKYFGKNPDFVRSALAQFSANDMLKWVQNHHIKTTQKKPGQYFCAERANIIIDALIKDIQGADLFTNTNVKSVTRQSDKFYVHTDSDILISDSVIVATGGVSYPNLGTSDIGYKIAKHFGHCIIPIRPALCAMQIKMFPADLAGISVPATVTIGKEQIDDDILFTHFGIGGPAIYRASVRDIDNGIYINLMPGYDVKKLLITEKQNNGRRSVATTLSRYIPLRLAKWLSNDSTKNIADYKDAELTSIANSISNIFIPRNQIKLHTLQSAEVVRGGVSTEFISSKSMESKLCPGLFFAGEVLDITGDLGGFNLQWAWASGWVAGKNA